MNEGGVDDAVRRRRAAAQAVEVLEVAALDFGARVGERLGVGVRAGQTDDAVAGGDEVPDDGGTDEAGRAGDEYAHEILLDFAAAARSSASPWAQEIGA